MQKRAKVKNDLIKCINCEYAVMSVKNPKMCKCWKVGPARRELKNAMVEHQCKQYKFGIMHNLQKRIGWKA